MIALYDANGQLHSYAPVVYQYPPLPATTTNITTTTTIANHHRQGRLENDDDDEDDDEEDNDDNRHHPHQQQQQLLLHSHHHHHQQQQRQSQQQQKYEHWLGDGQHLERGNLYLQTKSTDPITFEDYHRISADLEQGIPPNWESLDVKEWICSCQCNNCNGCTGKQQLLPKPTYILTVKDDIYQRVVKEIAESRSMPCGLFFCGHHEDVAHPSLAIPILILSTLFFTMAILAYYTGG